MVGEAAHLVVARFMKPHGLAGEALVFPMTDRPAEIFVPGRVLRPVSKDGRPVGPMITVAQGRPYQRKWLLRFEGIEDRTPLEAWRAGYLGVREAELPPPAADEMYEYEIAGATVVDGDTTIGTAKGLIGPDGNQFLVVARDGGDVLIPFRAPILREIARESRRIDVELPPGLLEL